MAHPPEFEPRLLGSRASDRNSEQATSSAGPQRMSWVPGDFKFRPVPRTFKPAKARTHPRSPVTGPPGPDARHARPATKPTRRFSESLLGVRFYQGTREPYSRRLFENSITRQPIARYPSGFRRPTQTDVVLDGKGICLAASGPTRGTFSSDEIEPSHTLVLPGDPPGARAATASPWAWPAPGGPAP